MRALNKSLIVASRAGATEDDGSAAAPVRDCTSVQLAGMSERDFVDVTLLGHDYRLACPPDGREQVLAASGAVGEIVTWSYDGRGRVTRREITSIGTSPYNTGERHTALQSWQYHANGRVSRYTHEKADAVTDLGASFAISEQEEYQFDNRGNLTHYTSLLGIDSGEPQEPYQRTYSWQYDSAGNLVRAEAANGEERSIQTWQYDANGNPTAYQGDEDGDGMYEQSAQYRYQKTGWGFLFAGVSPFGSNLPLPEKPGQSFDYIPPPQPPPVVPGR